ncbi:MAG: hypothetical protein WC358_10300, partial [Ignavibacteria bacterium]
MNSSSDDYPSLICIDQNNNIYVSGKMTNPVINYNTYIIKYNVNGIKLWEKKYKDYTIVAQTTDIQNNFYITGYYYPIPSSGNNDIFVTKYNSNGDSLWTKTYNGPGNYYDYPCTINIYNSNYIYITGESSGINRNFQYIALKYDLNGNLIWSAIDNTPIYFNNNATNGAVDNQGNVYVTGYADTTGSAYNRYFTIKFNNNGVQMWQAFYSYPTNYK